MPHNPAIIGATSYADLSAQQVDHFKSVFEKFITEIEPVRILEIGTAGGGLTLALNDIMNTLNIPFTIRTYDVYDQSWYWRLEVEGIEVRIENIFNHEYNAILPEKIDEIRNFIQGEGVTLVMCDGGSKLNEFKCLSEFLKPGDFIMAHDYAESPAIFEEKIFGIIWNWMEINGEQIAETCEKHNLQDYMKEEFENIVWACKVKR